MEVSFPEESACLSAISSFPGTQVACTPHATLNQYVGVIFSRDVMRYSNEKLLYELNDQGVVRVGRLQKEVDGVLVPTPTLFLTFDRLKLPEVVKLAWLRLPVKPYIPSPRRCFHCQAFGHISRSCRRRQDGLPAVCPSCGTMDHDGTTCPGPISCFHCRGPHPASSKDCDRYSFERQVLSIRTTEKIDFAEAKRRVLTMHIRPGVTYATMLFSLPNRRQLRKTTATVHQVAKPQSVSTTNPVALAALPSTSMEVSEELIQAHTATPSHHKRSKSEESLEEVPLSKARSSIPSGGSRRPSPVSAPAVTSVG